MELSIRRTENPDEYGITPVFEKIPFQRIRRITGYLVGRPGPASMMPNGSEVMDRVKHGM